MERINFNSPYISGNEMSYIEDVFRAGQFYGAGEFSRKCEAKISEIVDVERVLLTDSCTSALEIAALLIRNPGEPQSVIVPSYTFSSTASAFIRAGFRVIFCECSPLNMMIDVADAESRIEDDTVAIVGVHYGGLSAQIDDLLRMAREHELVLVEDAAQAFGCKARGLSLGSIGDFGCYSFHETKNLHCGLGGALLVNNESYYQRSRYILERGTNRQDVLKGLVDKYTWVDLGGSFYPTELQAAFLYAQLEGWNDNLRFRRRISETYYHQLLPLARKFLFTMPTPASDLETNHHAVFLILRSEVECDSLREFLVASGISAYIGYVPLHSSPFGRSLGNEIGSLPITEAMAPRVLRLPLHNAMSVEDVYLVCDQIKVFFDEN